MNFFYLESKSKIIFFGGGREGGMGVTGIVIFKYESKFKIKKNGAGVGGGARASEFFLQRIQI